MRYLSALRLWPAAGFWALLCAVLSLAACKRESKKVPEAYLHLATDPEIARLSRLIEQEPKNDSLYYLRAETYYQLDGFDEALADLQTAMSIDSMKPQYYHLLADVLIDYARPNDSKRAIEVLTLAAQRFPERIPTLLKLSEFQLIVRQHGDALATLDRIFRIDPRHPEAFFMAGRVALDMGDTTKALASFKKAVQYDAENTEAWMFMGRIYLNQNNATALQCFDNVLRVDSTNLEAREFKAVFHKMRGEFDQAFAIYRDIVRRNPDYSNAYFDMGMIYLELDSMSKAYDHFNLAVKTDPLFVMAYYYRGLTSELMGNPEAARADYVQASKMSPNYPEPKEALERLDKRKPK
ncbi:MAG: tetratricopeptide repeat protein [Saprospiraceae bacterium]|nr:tetratricopeptide repeat protein [Saprospiraceae bacterium]MDW8229799.1 tetratricopeptide repeat protein [Saprospiraceae bacterium]